MHRSGLGSRLLITLVVSCLLLAAPPLSRAQRPDAPTYGRRGPFAVGMRDLTISGEGRPLVVTIWYPALKPENSPSSMTYQWGLFSAQGYAIRDAVPDGSGGPYPLILFSHGLGGMRYQSIFLTEHLASYGFVVMAADHPGSTLFGTPSDGIVTNYALRPFDMLRQIAYADTLTAPGGLLARMIDTQRVAVTGHSFGGYTALAASGARLDMNALQKWCTNNPPVALDPGTVCFLRDQGDRIAELRRLTPTPDGLFPATTDPRIKAVVALAPWNAPIFGESGLQALTVSALVVVGTKDVTTVPERDAYRVYDEIGSKEKSLVTFDDAGHFIFGQSCPPLAASTLSFFRQCSDPVWDMTRAHDLINHFTVAFLLKVLKNDSQAAGALAPGKVDFVGVNYKTTLK